VIAGERRPRPLGSWFCHRMGVRARDQLPPVPLRLWLRLPLRGLASSLPGTGSKTDSQQGLNASDQRQSGTVHQDTPGEVGRPDRRSDIRRAQPLATPQPGDQQQPEVPHHPRWPQPSSVAPAAADCCM